MKPVNYFGLLCASLLSISSDLVYADMQTLREQTKTQQQFQQRLETHQYDSQRIQEQHRIESRHEYRNETGNDYFGQGYESRNQQKGMGKH